MVKSPLLIGISHRNTLPLHITSVLLGKATVESARRARSVEQYGIHATGRRNKHESLLLAVSPCCDTLPLHLTSTPYQPHLTTTTYCYSSSCGQWSCGWWRLWLVEVVVGGGVGGGGCRRLGGPACCDALPLHLTTTPYRPHLTATTYCYSSGCGQWSCGWWRLWLVEVVVGGGVGGGGCPRRAGASWRLLL